MPGPLKDVHRSRQPRQREQHQGVCVCEGGVDENSENTVRTCCAPDANSMGLYP